MAKSWHDGWSEVIKKVPLANDPAPTAPGADKRVSDEQIERDVQHTKHFRLTVMDTVLLGARYPADLRDARQALTAERARADEAEAERDEAWAANERDRSNVAVHLDGLRKAMEGRSWLREAGRGSYAYDDDRYQEEFGHALDEIEKAVEPLRRIARDWTHCPSDPAAIKAARTFDALSSASTRIRELEAQRDGRVTEGWDLLLRLTDELCNAVDNEGDDVGGSRGSLTILREIGPVVSRLKHAADPAPARAEQDGEGRS